MWDNAILRNVSLVLSLCVYMTDGREKRLGVVVHGDGLLGPKSRGFADNIWHNRYQHWLHNSNRKTSLGRLT